MVMSQVTDLHSACHGIHQIKDSKGAPVNKDDALNMLKNLSSQFVIYLLGKLWSSHSGHVLRMQEVTTLLLYSPQAQQFKIPSHLPTYFPSVPSSFLGTKLKPATKGDPIPQESKKKNTPPSHKSGVKNRTARIPSIRSQHGIVSRKHRPHLRHRLPEAEDLPGAIRGSLGRRSSVSKRWVGKAKARPPFLNRGQLPLFKAQVSPC